jgi:hypothetical protein
MTQETEIQIAYGVKIFRPIDMIQPSDWKPVRPRFWDSVNGRVLRRFLFLWPFCALWVYAMMQVAG